jgi:hypothetical protein
LPCPKCGARIPVAEPGTRTAPRRPRGIGLAVAGATLALLLGGTVAAWSLFRPDPWAVQQTGPGPASWKMLQSSEGRFRVLMPSQIPMTFTDPQHGDKGFRADDRDDEASVMVTYQDVPAADFAELPLDKRFRARRDQALLRFPNSKLLSERTITLGNYPGIEFSLTMADRAAMVTRIYAVGTRLYNLRVMGKPPLSPDSPVVRKVFDSFEVLDAPAKDQTESVPSGK